MAVAYQVSKHGMKPAGLEIFDISTPENPKSVAFFDCFGEFSRGVHQLWWVDGQYIHCSSGAADFTPRNLREDQFYRVIDVRNVTKPAEVGRWWVPGVRDGDSEPAPPRHPKFDFGMRVHNTNVYPERPNRAYLGCIDAGVFVLDISDFGRMKILGRWNPHPPFGGFTHTVLPLFDRNLLIVSDEATMDRGADGLKRTWVLDGSLESNPVPISTLPVPPMDEYRDLGGRYGAHNLHENRPGPSFRSSNLIFGTYFSGGVRVHEISNPFQPTEVAFFEPKAPQNSPANSAQINDVYVDENRIVYAVDRFTGGLYILELTI